ncbi:MAG: hypothetical protein F8N15_00425 [Methanobacterium sp.]|nr:hypothetical protein [Methanobacterium sp.]
MTVWPLYDNDRLADCSCAAAAHLITLWTGDAPPEKQVVEAYEAITGGRDIPLPEIAVLKYWRDTGIAGHRISGWTQIPHADLSHVRDAIAGGGLYACLALPESVESAALWEPEDGPTIGHFVAVIASDETGPICITWGREQPMTWAFWVACVRTAVSCEH